METAFDRQRVIISSLIIAAIVLASSAAIYWKSRKDREGSGKAGATVASGSAAAAGSKKGDKDAPKEKTPVPVSVAPVAIAPVSSYISSTTNLVAENEVKIVSEVEGRVSRLLVEEGQFVTAGQPLTMLNRDDAEIAMNKASVRSKNAAITYNRAQEMFNQKLMSRGDYDKSRMENDVASQELAEARWSLSKTVLRAPFAGRVTDRSIQLGQHIQPGQNLFTVTAYDPLIARIFLPEHDVLSLEEGREVRITMKSAQNVQFGGRIRQISPVVDPATGTVKVTIESVKPPAAVRPGSFVTVDIVRETHPKSIVVPRESVVRELQDAHVFVANGLIAQKRSVSLGLEEAGRIEILSGVKPGERVIVAGQGALRDGSPIKVLPATKG
ncbi:MAG: efflux RND transporter periplasmic adaptor subunit [Acidobacteriota bacterium]